MQKSAAILPRRTTSPSGPWSWRRNSRLNNEFSRRRDLVGAELATRKLDAFLVSSSASVRYLTGFTGSSGVLLILPNDAVLFTDPRYAIQSGREVSCKTIIAKGPLLPGV